MSLKPLDQHRKELEAIFEKQRKESTSTGVECPRCKEELHNCHPGLLLTSYPPQIQVECLSCGYTTSIICG